MRRVNGAAVFVLAGLIAIAPALAQAAPPPPPGDNAAPPPPPSDGPPPPGERPPPPPPPGGVAVIIDRGPQGRVHVDVHCSETDTTHACADIATQLFDKANTTASEK